MENFSSLSIDNDINTFFSGFEVEDWRNLFKNLVDLKCKFLGNYDKLMDNSVLQLRQYDPYKTVNRTALDALF